MVGEIEECRLCGQMLKLILELTLITERETPGFSGDWTVDWTVEAAAL